MAHSTAADRAHYIIHAAIIIIITTALGGTARAGAPCLQCNGKITSIWITTWPIRFYFSASAAALCLHGHAAGAEHASNYPSFVAAECPPPNCPQLIKSAINFDAVLPAPIDCMLVFERFGTRSTWQGKIKAYIWREEIMNLINCKVMQF